MQTLDGRECYAVICRAYQLHGMEGSIKDLSISIGTNRSTVTANVVAEGHRRFLRAFIFLPDQFISTLATILLITSESVSRTLSFYGSRLAFSSVQARFSFFSFPSSQRGPSSPIIGKNRPVSGGPKAPCQYRGFFRLMSVDEKKRYKIISNHYPFFSQSDTLQTVKD